MKKIIFSIVALAIVFIALIGINMMSNESSAKLEKWMAASQVETGTYYWDLNGINSKLWVSGSGVRTVSKKICFKKEFQYPPKVTLGFYHLDMLNNANFRANAYVAGVTTTKCFYAAFNTWSNSHPWAIGISWVAEASIF